MDQEQEIPLQETKPSVCFSLLSDLKCGLQCNAAYHISRVLRTSASAVRVRRDHVDGLTSAPRTWLTTSNTSPRAAPQTSLLDAKDTQDQEVHAGRVQLGGEVRCIDTHILFCYTNLITFICYATLNLVCNLFRNFRNTEFIQYLTMRRVQ